MIDRNLLVILSTLVVWAALSAPAASALDLAPEQLLYAETYLGESSYPTTPEVDRAQAGGLDGYSFTTMGPSAVGPTLTGDAARVVIGGGPDLAMFSSIGATQMVGSGSVGLRGAFEGFVHVGDGTAFAAVDSEFLVDLQSWIRVSAGLLLTRSGSVQTATLRVIETDVYLGSSTSADLALSPRESDALFGGAGFTIDLFVDKGASVADGSVRVDGFGSPNTTQIAIAAQIPPAGVSVSQYAGVEAANAPTSMQVDMRDFEVYSAPAPTLNIDLGVFHGPAPSGYGAAGPAGIWNEAPLGTTALVDLAGVPTAVTVDVSAAFIGAFAGGPADAEALLGDVIYGCSPKEWFVSVSGLPLGRYEVIVYATAHSSIATGALDVGGELLPSMPGDVGFGLIEGTSWARVEAQATGGSLAISGNGGTLPCAGIAGLQLVPIPVASPVPVASPPGLLLMVALLVATGVSGLWSRGRSALGAAFLLAFLVVVSAPSASAVDGVIEVSQASVMASGGYPWSPTTGNYRLTSDLRPVGSLGISLEADDITIDFNGFALIGDGSGFDGISGGPAPDGHRLRNGTIRGFGGRAVTSVASCSIEQMQIKQNAGGGLEVGPNCEVHRNRLSFNGGVGGLAGQGSGVVYSANLFFGNSGGNVSGAVSNGGNHCDGEPCAPPRMRRFYLSLSDQLTGGEPRDAGSCAEGFHMASLWEIYDVSGLRYDDTRGYNFPNSDGGPPAGEPGWIRTGWVPSSIATPGEANCIGWGTGFGSSGTTVALGTDWDASGPDPKLGVWRVGVASCDAPQRVWCVED